MHNHIDVVHVHNVKPDQQEFFGWMGKYFADSKLTIQLKRRGKLMDESLKQGEQEKDERVKDRK